MLKFGIRYHTAIKKFIYILVVKKRIVVGIFSPRRSCMANKQFINYGLGTSTCRCKSKYMTYHTIAVTTNPINNRPINSCLIVEKDILLYVYGFWGIKLIPSNIDPWICFVLLFFIVTASEMHVLWKILSYCGHSSVTHSW